MHGDSLVGRPTDQPPCRGLRLPCKELSGKVDDAKAKLQEQLEEPKGMADWQAAQAVHRGESLWFA